MVIEEQETTRFLVKSWDYDLNQRKNDLNQKLESKRFDAMIRVKVQHHDLNNPLLMIQVKECCDSNHTHSWFKSHITYDSNQASQQHWFMYSNLKTGMIIMNLITNLLNEKDFKATILTITEANKYIWSKRSCKHSINQIIHAHTNWCIIKTKTSIGWHYIILGRKLVLVIWHH